MEYRTELQVRIDWADLDLFGHVNNVAFFRYVQAARINYCEKIGLNALDANTNLGFMVASSQCQYKKPVVYPGSIFIKTGVEWIKNTSLQLAYRLFNEAGDLVAEATDVIVVFDHQSKTKVTINSSLRTRIAELEGWSA